MFLRGTKSSRSIRSLISFGARLSHAKGIPIGSQQHLSILAILKEYNGKQPLAIPKRWFSNGESSNSSSSVSNGSDAFSPQSSTNFLDDLNTIDQFRFAGKDTAQIIEQSMNALSKKKTPTEIIDLLSAVASSGQRPEALNQFFAECFKRLGVHTEAGTTLSLPLLERLITR